MLHRTTTLLATSNRKGKTDRRGPHRAHNLIIEVLATGDETGKDGRNEVRTGSPQCAAVATALKQALQVPSQASQASLEPDNVRVCNRLTSVAALELGGHHGRKLGAPSRCQQNQAI